MNRPERTVAACLLAVMCSLAARGFPFEKYYSGGALTTLRSGLVLTTYALETKLDLVGYELADLEHKADHAELQELSRRLEEIRARLANKTASTFSKTNTSIHPPTQSRSGLAELKITDGADPLAMPAADEDSEDDSVADDLWDTEAVQARERGKSPDRNRVINSGFEVDNITDRDGNGLPDATVSSSWAKRSDPDGVPDAWRISETGSCRLTTNAHHGRFAVAVDKINPTTFLDIQDCGGKTYTVSAYIKGSLDDDIAYWLLYYKLADGNLKYMRRQWRIEKEYGRYSVSLAFPKNASRITELRLGHGRGTVYWDAVQLEEGDRPTSYVEGPATTGELTYITTWRDDLLNEIVALENDVGELTRKFAAAAVGNLDMPLNVWMTNTFHRIHCNHYGLPVPGLPESFEIMRRTHTTAVIEQVAPNWRDAHYERLGHTRAQHIGAVLKEAEKNNLRVMHLIWSILDKDGHRISPEDMTCRTIDGKDAGHCYSSPRTVHYNDQTLKYYIDQSRHSPAFMGIEWDEYAIWNGYCDGCVSRFREYLKSKYTDQQRVELGFGDIAAVTCPKPGTHGENKVLWMEYQEFRAHIFENTMRQVYDHARAAMPGVVMFPALNTFHYRPFDSSFARMSLIGDLFGMDPYWSGAQEEAFWCELARRQAKCPTVLVVGAHHQASIDTYRTDLAISYAHTQGLWIFDWPYVWKQRWWPGAKSMDQLPQWNHEMWQATVDAFAKIKRMEQYLVRTASASDVAMLYSERSVATDPSERRRLYAKNQMGLYIALSQCHIPVDPVYAETLDHEKLDQYAVLIIADARSLTDQQIIIIRQWVNAGGFLIATASTTLQDRWGRRLDDYRMADVFGVNYRDSKPIKPRVCISMTSAGKTGLQAILPSEIVYRSPAAVPPELRCMDVIEPRTAATLVEWQASSVMTQNQYGKGQCVFIAVPYIGLSYENSKLARDRRRHLWARKRFSEGILPLLRRSVVMGLSVRGKTLPFEVADCPLDVEVTMRRQPGRDMLHFLNYVTDYPVSGVKVRVNVPNARRVTSVFYADDKVPVKCQLLQGSLQFTLRDFDVHDLVVIETSTP